MAAMFALHLLDGLSLLVNAGVDTQLLPPPLQLLQQLYLQQIPDQQEEYVSVRESIIGFFGK